MANRWDGAYGQPGAKTNGNKGVQWARRGLRRAQAEARNRLTVPGKRRAAAKAAGFSRHSDRIRAEK